MALAMKIKYTQETDTLHIELCPAEEGRAQELDETTLLRLDEEGRLCSVTIERASDRIDMPSLKRVSGNARGVLNLTIGEQGWLDEYRRQLEEKFPGLVEDIIIYGPYARGVSDPDVDMQVLVIIREGDSAQEEKVGGLGHDIDSTGFWAAPSILVYARDDWGEGRRTGVSHYERAAADGISVL